MLKIPCLFVRDFSQRPPILFHVVTDGCEWVMAGEGTHTRKWDGTAVLARDGKLYARFDCKKGRTPPDGFEPCQDEPDAVTGHWPGWVPVTDQPQYKWHAKTHSETDGGLQDGTYELCGPKVNGNPEGLESHVFIRHGSPHLMGVVGDIAELTDRSFEGINAYLADNVMEGLVFHAPDGRMAKIRRADFGLAWPLKPGS